MEKLSLSQKQFDRLVVLCSVYPIESVRRNCTEHTEDDWYYTISDIKRLYYSDAYTVLKKNAHSTKKRDEYAKQGRADKAAQFEEEEYDLIQLLKSKYSSFGDSLADLCQSLRNLYLIQRLGIAQCEDTVNMWESFVLEYRLLEKAFLSRKGIFFSFDIEKITVLWSIPYPCSRDFTDVIEEKRELVKRVKQSVDIPELADCGLSSSEDETDTENAQAAEKLDISILSYAAKMYVVHIQLCVHKLRLLLGPCGLDHDRRGPGLFRGMRICVAVDSIREQLEFILKNEQAVLVMADAAAFVIAESVDEIRENVVYLQPQYILDSLNKKRLLDFNTYKISKALPAHVSPFPDILETLDQRTLKTLSNSKKYKILSKVEELN